MEIDLRTSCQVAKKMSTDRQKGDDDLVTCTLAVKKIRVSKAQAEELAGVPNGSLTPLFDDLHAPRQRMSFLLPQRVLLIAGKIEHRKESGAAIATLSLTQASIGSIRLNLDTPDDQGATLLLSFAILWKARGDEVEDVQHLLDKRGFIEMTFREEPQQPLNFDSASSPKAEAEAGHRAALERKRAEESKPPESAPQAAPSATARKVAAALERGNKISASGGKVVDLQESKFAREAREHAKRNPKKPPKPKK